MAIIWSNTEASAGSTWCFYNPIIKTAMSRPKNPEPLSLGPDTAPFGVSEVADAE